MAQWQFVRKVIFLQIEPLSFILWRSYERCVKREKALAGRQATVDTPGWQRNYVKNEWIPPLYHQYGWSFEPDYSVVAFTKDVQWHEFVIFSSNSNYWLYYNISPQYRGKYGKFDQKNVHFLIFHTGNLIERSIFYRFWYFFL